MTDISDIISQISTAPVGLLIVLAVNVLGYLLKASAIPNAFIPPSGAILAVLGNVFMGDPGKCAPYLRHPETQLAFVGLVYWAAAWMFHAQILKRFGLDAALGFGENRSEPTHVGD